MAVGWSGQLGNRESGFQRAIAGEGLDKGTVRWPRALSWQDRSDKGSARGRASARRVRGEDERVAPENKSARVIDPDR